MRVLISHDGGGAHWYDRIGFKRVLDYCGHTCEIWNIQEKSPHDAFAEFQPDIFLGQLHNVSRGVLKCLLQYPVKVALKVGHWGDVDKDIDTKVYPVLVASDEQKKTAETLQKAGKLDYVFVHYHPNRIPYTLGSWTSIVKPVGIPNACDLFAYLGGKFDPRFECDCSIISGYWPYKAINLNKFIGPLCSPIGKFNIKIYGNAHWPFPQYLGTSHEENSKHIFASTKINLDVSEPHSAVFGFDVTERIFKVGINGFYLNPEYVASAHEDFFPNTLMHLGEDNWEEFLRYWLDNPEEREIPTKELRRQILENHTYFDRVAQTFREFGLDDKEFIEGKKKYLGTNS